MILPAFFLRLLLPGLLLGLGLNLILLFSGKPALTQPVTPDLTMPLPQRTSLPKSSTHALDTKTPLMTQGVRKTVLENGLTVLTKEVHTAPVVSVQVWYQVGSRNEAPGVNGIAHQLEHLLFKGTVSRPIQFGRLFSALGSNSNAFTSYDQTAYFGTVARDKLQALLALEADRMQNSLIDAEQLSSEKRVVISELQGYENSPDYRLSRAVMRAAFPSEAYGLPVGGTKADVERFTVEQVREYYRNYYSPSNAILIITGDFETESVLQTVKDLFGNIPNATVASDRPQPPGQPRSPVATKTTTRPQDPIVLREPGSAALLQVVYPLPDIQHPDVPALDVMNFIVSEGRNSRLYQAWVESGLVSNFNAHASNLIEAGWYEISATAATGQSLNKIDQVLQQVLTRLRNQGVTEAELQRAKAQLQALMMLQNRDITSQAMQLGYDQTTTGDYRFTDRYLAAIAQVTVLDVQRVAQTYLQPSQRTVGFFEPTQFDGQGAVSAMGAKQTSEDFSPGEPVDPREVAKYLPELDAKVASTNQALPEALTLQNGLRVLLLPDASTPTVTLSGYIQAGSELDEPNKAGLASLVADNLMNGTQTQDALSLAAALEDRGANLAFDANREGVAIDGSSLAKDLPVLIQTLADVVQNAAFPDQELQLSRQRTLTELAVSLDDPGYVGRRVFQQAIYPQTHPFHAFPTEASLRQITRSDVSRFYRTYYRPDTTILTLVGNFDMQQVRSLLESQLGNWQAQGNPPALSFPPVSLPPATVHLTPDLPSKTQSITYIGSYGIDRQDPRYYAALVLNHIIGGDTLSSRLGAEVRDRQGLTYGIYSYFQAGKRPGPFLIQMQTAPEDAEAAIASTLTLLQQLRAQGVTAAEVDAAKRSLISSYPVDLADPDNLANTILLNEVYGLDREELRQLPRQLETLTLDQVNQAAQELLHPDQLFVVTAGPPLDNLQTEPESNN